MSLIAIPKCSAALAVLVIILLGMGIRISWMNESALWCDEAESSINALTIIGTGVPGWKYVGLPIFENTLTKRWEENPEYEFRDSTYSDRGVVVYHGWLPIYAIAASQYVFGLRPDEAHNPPRVLHGVDEIDIRTLAPRVPALIFSLGTMLVIFFVGYRLGGLPTAFAALTLMAFNAQTVDFGYQARYYSATLFFNALAAWALVLVIERGRWRDFISLGVTAALLFHTHLFSVMAFTMVACAAIPAIIKKRDWFWKSLVGAGISAALVLPWILLTGFLGTASHVPMIYTLFESKWDAMVFILDRPIPLALTVLVAVLLVVAKWKPSWLPRAISDPLRDHGFIYSILLIWLVAAYVAFHLIVPAASFFFERLSLVLWTPFVLFISLFVGDILSRIRVPVAATLAVVAMLGFLSVRSRLAFFENPIITSKRPNIAAMIEALETKNFPAGTKIYVNPSEHLTITYYTGMPVQSVAPIRRSFLNGYPGTVVYIYMQLDVGFANEYDLLEAAAWGGIEPTTENLWAINQQIWTALTFREMSDRGIKIPHAVPVPEFLTGYVEKTYWESVKNRNIYLTGMDASPVMRGIPATKIKDLWLGFFYRFVDPASRIGSNLNIIPRLQNADVIPVPGANAVLFISPEPVLAAPDKSAP